LEHHFDTVEVALPNRSAGHLPVLFFSARIIFIGLPLSSLSSKQIVNKDIENYTIGKCKLQKMRTGKSSLHCISFVSVPLRRQHFPQVSRGVA
jgi:hypothetical protein